MPRATIELLVLSHIDSDHLGDVAENLDEYTVRSVLWMGFWWLGAEAWERTRSLTKFAVGGRVRSLTTHPLI